MFAIFLSSRHMDCARENRHLKDLIVLIKSLVKYREKQVNQEMSMMGIGERANE